MFFGGEGTFTVSLALRSLGNRLTHQNYMVLVDFCQVLKGVYLKPKVRNELQIKEVLGPAASQYRLVYKTKALLYGQVPNPLRIVTLLCCPKTPGILTVGP